MPTAKDALAQKYPEMAALCCEGWMARRTPASHFLAYDWQRAHESALDAWQHTAQSKEFVSTGTVIAETQEEKHGLYREQKHSGRRMAARFAARYGGACAFFVAMLVRS